MNTDAAVVFHSESVAFHWNERVPMALTKSPTPVVRYTQFSFSVPEEAFMSSHVLMDSLDHVLEGQSRWLESELLWNRPRSLFSVYFQHDSEA